MNVLTIPALQGVNQEGNARIIPITNSQDCLNVIYENGKLKSRYGLKNILTDQEIQQINFQDVYGVDSISTPTVYSSSIMDAIFYTYTDKTADPRLFILTDTRIWTKDANGTLTNSTPKMSLPAYTSAQEVIVNNIHKGFCFTYTRSALLGKTTKYIANIQPGNYLWITVGGVEKAYRINLVESNETYLYIYIMTGFTGTPSPQTFTIEHSRNPIVDSASNFSWSYSSYFDSATGKVGIVLASRITPLAVFFPNANNRFQYANEYIWGLSGPSDADKQAAMEVLPIKPEFIQVYGGRLIAANPNETEAYSQKIYWSGPGMNVASPFGYLDFRATMGSGYIILANSPDVITGFKMFKNTLYIFKEDSVTEVLSTDDYRQPLIFNENKLSVGTPCIRSVADIGDGLFFFANDDIYLFDGMYAKPIANEVKETVYNILNYDSLENFFSLDMANFHTVLFFYCTGTGYNARPTKCLAYNYKYQLWSFFDFSNMLTSDQGFMGRGVWLANPGTDTYKRWEDYGDDSAVTPTWGSYDGRVVWGDTIFSHIRPIYILSTTNAGANNPSSLVFYDKESSVDYLQTSPITCNVVTKDIDFQEMTMEKFIQQVTFLVSAVTPFNVTFSLDMGRTWCGYTSVNPYINEPAYPYFAGESAEMVDRTVNLLLKGKRFRMRITSTSLSRFEVESMTIRFLQSGIGLER